MRKIKLAIIFLILGYGISFSQTIGDTEFLTPENANIFIKTRPVKRLIKSFDYMIYNILNEEQRTSIINQRAEFRDKTGIDYLNEDSLNNFGIDTNRELSYAIFPEDTGREVTAFFIPVKNANTFAERFTEIMKKANPEISPISVNYKDITVTELKKDLYFASINNYFIVTSTDDCIKSIIDVYKNRNGSLILNPKYKKYLTEGKNNFDVNIYISAELIAKAFSTPQGNDSQNNSDAEETFDSDLILNSLEYISAGFGIDGNTLKLKGTVLFAEDNPYVEMMLGLLKTGQAKKALDLNVDSSIFISLNYKYLNNLCKSNAPFCTQYNAFKKILKEEAKIDFEKEILPYLNGMTNLFFIDSGTLPGDMVIFLAIEEPQKAEELWKKFKKSVQARYSKNKKFGEERIDGKNSFWYIDESNTRYFVSFDSRGIYTGNNVILIKNALNSTSFEKKATPAFKGRLNDKTFLFVNIKKNPFLRNMLLMKTEETNLISPLLSSFKEMNIFCEKQERLILLGIEIELKSAN